MEMKMPHPKTQELTWAPKLFPSSQTPVKDGLEVRFDCEPVRSARKHALEYYLLNHPLDCPVCDKAGECYLQDYTEEVGPAASRMIEEKQKNPKKDVGPHTLLYQDRCVLCTRCVRFCNEIAGTGELAVVNRGSQSEIDAFPGQPLANPLQGNVVDLCPVGALLDKGFLFKQRVWLLKSVPSVSPADSRGQTIWIDSNEQGLHRIRPRFNEQVNEWWISDEARFGWKAYQRPDRLTRVRVRGADGLRSERWEAVAPALWAGLGANGRALVERPGRLAVVLSPMLSCEEAWMLAKYIRGLDPQALLVLGYVPTVGEDRKFPKGFVIAAEKCPNRRGIETLLQHFGGPTADWQTFLGQAVEGRLTAAYVTGGYPTEWVTPAVAAALAKVPYLVVHDLFPSALEATASMVIPGATWWEREGTFMNSAGLVQAFERALPPVEGVKVDGQFLLELAKPVLPGGAEAWGGLYRAEQVRAALGREIPALADVFVPRPMPEHAH
jgi:NADH-quinone oxidoreductase subunit G